MREKIAVFGERNSLIGIVSEPESKVENSDDIAIIFLNSGLLHRIGPNRLYVKLSRKLASSGFVALRFDLSGIGDSQRANKLPPEKSAIKDIQYAMNFLVQTRGIRSFMLAGICSGADDAFRTACEDSRVIGITMIEGFAFESMDFFLNVYLRRVLRPGSWRRLITGKSDILGMLKRRLFSKGDSVDSEESDPIWPRPDADEVRKGFEILAERGVEVCSIFCDDGAAYYCHKKHYAKMMKPLGDKSLVQVFSGTDHLFSPLQAQKSLMDAVDNWATRVAANQEIYAEGVPQ